MEDKVSYLKPYVATENWYMAISKKSKYARFIPTINKIFDRLVQNGTVDNLIAKYMEYYEEHVLNRVRQLVEEGIIFYKENGRQSAFTEINNPQGRLTRGDLYLFVIDFNGKCLSHGADPKLIGRNLIDLQDTDGKQFIKDFIKVARTKGEGWVAYKWPYKQTGKIEPKISYVKRIDDSDLFIGCGFYTTK
ncbi:MAG: cache domain-containing protein [Candidatus Omnitrophica bacterium]|nr:cache domain-containing protein [Candidatus Omnitrophota bacterium]